MKHTLTVEKQKSRKVITFAVLFVLSASLIFGISRVSSQTETTEDLSAQKSYKYKSIVAKVDINKDTTINVEERQTFEYVGLFHAGWREIPLNKIDAITDISVIDGETGLEFKRSFKRLDKLDSENWGKFATFQKNGKQNIEWYYNLKDTEHEWILKYKVHGAIEFQKENDRLYWNVFTNYSVPVEYSKVVVVLPEEISEDSAFINSYRNSFSEINQKMLSDNKTFVFESDSRFEPNEAFTIDVSWQKGIIKRSSYFTDFIKMYFGYIISALVFVISLIYGFIFWFVKEKSKSGKRSIIPQYEPPEKLPPAMAEVVVKERLTTKGLSATIVDLAVRGYVKIEEDKKISFLESILGSKNLQKNLTKVTKITRAVSRTSLILFSIIIFVAFVFFAIKNAQSGGIVTASIALIIFVLFVFMFLSKKKGAGGKMFQGPKTYTVLLVNKDFENDKNLHDYEKKYMHILFENKNQFSTLELTTAGNMEKSKFRKAIENLKNQIYEEAEMDTGAFEIGVSKEKRMVTTMAFSVLIIYGFIAFIFGAIHSQLLRQIATPIFVSLPILYSLRSFMKYEARLSESGRILKESWLGFKMYLEVAEKHRLQNLSPDLFQKYLPYAMMFGVEKKWSNAFSGIKMQAPNWYVSHNAALYSNGIGATDGGFSASSFSASFSSAFTSAFSNSGAGGGGGSAGGGGGGGGGGAS